MGTKDFNRPKVLSDGPEIVKQFDGLVKAHFMETILPLKGNLVKPGSFSGLYNGQSTWEQGESSRGRPRWVAQSSVSAAAPASATVDSELLVTTAVPARATRGFYFGFSGVERTNRRLREDT